MRIPWRRFDGFINIITVLCLAAIWVAFAPVKLGGQAAFVLVNGVSMKPVFHSGDLVIVRQAPVYQVGDIIAFQDPLLGVSVIHRIVDVREDRYVTQGDNNTWIDSYKPTRADIIGKLWLHLPGMAPAMEWVRAPVNMAFAFGLIGSFSFKNLLSAKPGKKGKKKGAGPNSPAGPVGLFGAALYALLALAGLFLALTIYAFTRPLTRAADTITYNQFGVFSYTALGAPNVYDAENVSSGEPVFTELACVLDLSFTYRLEGERLSDIVGNQQIVAVLMDEQSGWRRTIPLIVNKKFKGSEYTSAASLDLCKLQGLIAEVEKKTGVRLGNYTLSIRPQISVEGKISGQEFADSFEPSLNFKFDNLRFYLLGNSAQQDPLRTGAGGSVVPKTRVENRVGLLGLQISVQALRSVSLTGLGVALLGLLGLAGYFLRRQKQDPDMIIRLKYAGMLIEVTGQGPKKTAAVIEVGSVDDLARLAERQNGMIMHQVCKDGHVYFVLFEGATYRYTAGQAAPPADPQPAQPE
jgi:signal peptidase I